MHLLLLACAPSGGSGELISTTDGWYLPFGGAASDDGVGITQLDGGDMVLATNEDISPTTATLHAYRTDNEGTVVWDRSENDRRAHGISNSGTLSYIGGQQVSEEPAAFLMALDSETGWVEWEWRSSSDWGIAQVQGIAPEDQNVYLSGWATTTQGNDMLLAKLDKDGNELWVTTWGGARWDEANALALDDNALYVAGLLDGDEQNQGGDAIVAAFSKKNGNPLWQMRLGTEAGLWDDALGLSLFEGRLYVVGSAASSSFDLKIWCLETDGTLVWERDFGGNGDEWGRSLVVDSNGLWVGFSTSSEGAGQSDMALLRMDLDGNNPKRTLLWGGTGTETVQGLQIQNGQAYLMGQSNSFGAGEEDAVLLRATAKTEQSVTVP